MLRDFVRGPTLQAVAEVFLLVMRLVFLVVLGLVLGAVVFGCAAHAQVPPDAARYRAGLVRAAHSQWGLDAPIAALAAQVHQESGWNPQAVSRVGAAGMAQFMPQTAKWWCNMNGMDAAQCQPTNPTWALRALAGYDKYLYDRTPAGYARFDRMWVALRGYNGGLGHWTAEARNAANGSRQAVDAACGTARRARVHCTENLGYPARILGVLQPRYATWGPVVSDGPPQATMRPPRGAAQHAQRQAWGPVT